MANFFAGWDSEDYISHIDKTKETGTLTDYIGIGIPPITLRKTKAVEEIVATVKNALPKNIKLH